MSVSHNLGRIRYFTQSVQQELRPGTCSYMRLRFLSRCWDHIVESFACLGAHTQNRVPSWLRTFAKKNLRCIGKYFVYFNTVLCLISSFTILILQIFQYYLFHFLSGNYCFGVIFSIILIFIFVIWYHNICSFHEKFQFWCPTSDYKTKLRSNHQKTVWWTRLVCNSKLG